MPYPKPESPPDVRALRAGTPAAWDLLYADFAPRVLGYLLRLGIVRADAEDLVQETFLAAYNGRHGFRNLSQPLAWLLGIARRRWHDRARSTHPTESPPDDVPDHQDIAAQITSNATAEAWLAQLSIADREIIVLSVIHGLTYREIAEIIDKPVGTVKWRAAESLKRLRAFVAEEPHHETDIVPKRSGRPDGAPTDRKPARSTRAPTPSPDRP